MPDAPVIRKRGLMTFAATALLLSALFAWANLSDFIKVGIHKDTGGYPFGTEGPWPYRSAALYARVSLVYGILFLACGCATAWAVLGNKQKVLPGAFIGTALMLLVQLIGGKSE